MADGLASAGVPGDERGRVVFTKEQEEQHLQATILTGLRVLTVLCEAGMTGPGSAVLARLVWPRGFPAERYVLVHEGPGTVAISADAVTVAAQARWPGLRGDPAVLERFRTSMSVVVWEDVAAFAVHYQVQLMAPDAQRPAAGILLPH